MFPRLHRTLTLQTLIRNSTTGQSFQRKRQLLETAPFLGRIYPLPVSPSVLARNCPSWG